MQRAAAQVGSAPVVHTNPVQPEIDLSGIAELPRSAYADGAKRLVDIVITLLLAPLIVPLMGICAVIVMLDGHAPFFGQERVGQNGRVYRMWKLRSMVPQAEAALEAHLATDETARAEWDRHQKLRHDPRITQFGRIMRAFSLDELPQFWNVLRGDMSLVGPRPMLPCQMDRYPGQSYYALRPGLTGPWQVSDRHASSFADRALYDDFYARQMSLRYDVGLVIVTVGVVFRGTGC